MVYSNVEEIGLQEIVLKHEKKRYFYNPEGKNDMKFQNYVSEMRRIMVEKCKSPISLLFP